MTRINQRGPIAWMANNPMAANLLMMACLLGGLIVASHIKQEFLPEPSSQRAGDDRLVAAGQAPSGGFGGCSVPRRG